MFYKFLKAIFGIPDPEVSMKGSSVTYALSVIALQISFVAGIYGFIIDDTYLMLWALFGIVISLLYEILAIAYRAYVYAYSANLQLEEIREEEGLYFDEEEEDSETETGVK